MSYRAIIHIKRSRRRLVEFLKGLNRVSETSSHKVSWLILADWNFLIKLSDLFTVQRKKLCLISLKGIFKLSNRA
jgi:hypothetical protein